MVTSQQRESSPGTIRSLIPARLDRLPWSRFHTRLVIALNRFVLAEAVRQCGIQYHRQGRGGAAEPDGPVM